MNTEMRYNEHMRNEVREILQELLQQGNLQKTGLLYQHGGISILEHSIRVAEMSLFLVEYFHLRIDRRSMIRGALLHDYALLNRKKQKGMGRYTYVFTHPGTAVKNASEDYDLNSLEENIIKRHMFPLTPIPPLHREAWLVTLADKICASREMLSRYPRTH